MAEVRFTNGTGRYTANYTKPTIPFWFDAFETYAGSVVGLSTYPARVTMLTVDCEKIKSVLTDGSGNFSVSLPVAVARGVCDSDDSAIASIILDNVLGD